MRTNTGKRQGRFKLAWLAAFLLLMLGPAQATFHLMKIVEVFPGTAAAPQAQYVVIQMYAAGQNLLAGHDMVFYNASNQMVASFVFPNNVPNGANQAKILIATPQAAAFFNVAADATMPASLISAGGKVCFADSIDCVAWGAFAGPPAGVGTPFNQLGGLLPGRAMVRRLNISGGATTLENADDTNNCEYDFAFGTPAPRNNNNQTGMVPASTCGNGHLEGLEQCDDGNLANGDSCSSTCLVTTPPPYRPSSDFNGDARADVVWRNTQSGGNTIWRSAIASQQQGVSTVPIAWQLVGVGDFDANGRADLLWRNTTSGANAIWRGAIASSQIPVSSVPSQSWKVVGVGDFDGDGRSDILWRNDVSGQNTIWRSGSASAQMGIASVPNLQWRVVGVGDFNGDRRADIFWRNTATGGNTIWRSGNAATPQGVSTVPVAWIVAGVGDFSGDGIADVFWRNTSTGGNAIWRSANSATAAAAASLPNQAWRVEAVADYDGDRKADVFWRNASTGGNVLWRSGNGATAQALTSVTNLAWTVVP